MKRQILYLIFTIIFFKGADSNAQNKWMIGLKGGVTKFNSQQGTNSGFAYGGFTPYSGNNKTSIIYGRRYINEHLSAKAGLGILSFSSGFSFEKYGVDQTKYGTRPQFELGVDYHSSNLVGKIGFFGSLGVGVASFPPRPSIVPIGGDGKSKIFSYYEYNPDGTSQFKEITVEKGTIEFADSKELFFLRPELGIDFKFSTGNRLFLSYQYSYKIGQDLIRVDYSKLIINGNPYTQTQLFHGSYSAFQIGYEVRIK